METLDALKADVGFDDVLYDDQIGKVSVIGVGMRSHPGVSAKFFSALADVGVNIEMISTSEIRISVIVDQDDVDRAVVATHVRWVWTPPKRQLFTPVPAAEAPCLTDCWRGVGQVRNAADASSAAAAAQQLGLVPFLDFRVIGARYGLHRRHRHRAWLDDLSDDHFGGSSDYLGDG